MIRIAAVGDVHVGRDRAGFSPDSLERLDAGADLLLLAGDLTEHGYASEAERLANELREVSIPVVAVLGNHDYQQGEQARIRHELERAEVQVLEATATALEIGGVVVGIGGAKGFGGGFRGASATEYGEEEMKSFVRHSRAEAERLAAALTELDSDVKIALTHYAPAMGTLQGERLEIYPFLGSYFLGDAVDKGPCAVAFHGHAHAGKECAETEGGVPVRNVARPVLRASFKVYLIEQGQLIRAQQ